MMHIVIYVQKRFCVSFSGVGVGRRGVVELRLSQDCVPSLNEKCARSDCEEGAPTAIRRSRIITILIMVKR